MNDDSHYLGLAAAYARGALARPELGDDAAVAAAAEAGLRMHRFKRTGGLARVRKVIGVLRGLAPVELLDVGSGRGAFLWPLLDELPWIEVTAVDRLAFRVADIESVRRGGVARVRALEMDATSLDFPDARFDVVTQLEVLEHLQDPAAAAREAVRVARTAVVATVPSAADDNPEHIQLFDRARLERLFADAGARRVTVEAVLGHFVVVAGV